MKKDRKEKTKFSEILPSNQIITTCHIELRAKEMTMNEKLTMIGLRWNRNIFTFDFSNKQSNGDRKWGQTSFQISPNVFLIKESSLQHNCPPYRRHGHLNYIFTSFTPNTELREFLLESLTVWIISSIKLLWKLNLELSYKTHLKR